jgi:hypothetical protein
MEGEKDDTIIVERFEVDCPFFWYIYKKKKNERINRKNIRKNKKL